MILVTGGAGFIGSNFVLDWLDSAEHRDEPVVNLDALTYAGNLENLAALEGNPRHIFVKGDICDRALVDQLLGLLADKARLEDLSKAGQRASLQYDWEVVADNVFEVYRLAIDMGSPAASGTRRTRDLIRGRQEHQEREQ